MVSKIRRSLPAKLSISILLLAVPIFVLSLGIMFLQSRYFIRQEATARANSMLLSTMQRVRTYLNTIETATNSNLWLVEEDFSPETLLSVSSRIVWMNRHVNGCSITAEPGVFPQFGRYFSAYSIRIGDSVKTVREAEYEYFDKVWYKTARELGSACWVEPYDDYNEGTLYTTELIASYCKPLHTKDGRFVGIISTDLSLRNLASAINSASHPYPHAYFMLLGGNGDYIIHPDTTRILKKTIFTDADPQSDAGLIVLGHEMTAGNKGCMRVKMPEGKCLVSYCPLTGTNWSLALVCPESDILWNYHQLAYLIVLLIITGLLIILLLCRRAVAHTIHPLSQLLLQSERIASGHYDSLIPHTHREDVIGQLQNSFAAMQESLNFHLGSIRYTTEVAQQRNDELVQANLKAEEAVKQKTLFIQNVTHQIRTPLNILTGFSQVMYDCLSQQNDGTSILPAEELANITETMKHNATTLTRLVLMLFDCSDIGLSEELNSHKHECVSCNEVGREAIAYTMSHFPNLNILFETELTDDFCIPSSQLYLMRSLRELLYNAAKYSDGQHIKLFITHTDSFVRFIVEDTGPGISEDYYDLMYKPFTKVDDLSEGLGLGLPLTKRHAISLGGDLIYDRDYRDGCRFTLEVPDGK